MDRDLAACLPAELRGPATTITRIAVGLSGAGVYRVDAGGDAFVLKVASADAPFAPWRRTLELQQLAAAAGLAPRIVHVDEAARAVVSAFVVDRSFRAWFGDPRTRDAALGELGRTLRRVHDLPLPADAEVKQPLDLLARIAGPLVAGFALPAFVGDTIARVQAEVPPARDRAPVLSHDDVNPTNLAYDGARIVLLDWDAAGANDPFYDLAAVSIFLRMDDATCARLLAAYDGDGAAPLAALPARFAYHRRLVAVLCGTLFLHLARAHGHAGGDATLAATPGLGELYLEMRAGTLSPATADGQWRFGLALIKASAAL